LTAPFSEFGLLNLDIFNCYEGKRICERAHENIQIVQIAECGAKCKLCQIFKNTHVKSNKIFTTKQSNFH